MNTIQIFVLASTAPASVAGAVVFFVMRHRILLRRKLHRRLTTAH